MSSFYVNGNIVKCEGSMSLLRYLRDELRLTSVKDGCSEGACGTCTVIIDGRAMKACVQRTDRLGGKHIITTEGLSEFEKGSVCIRLRPCGRGAMRLLHAGHGNGGEGAAG